MRLETVGQSIAAEWCQVSPQTLAGWIHTRTDWPPPDVIIRTQRHIIRGWLPERKAEWVAYAKIRANSPGALLVAQRPDRQKR